MDTKDILRKRYFEKRKSIKDLEERSLKIADLLFKMSEYKECENIFLFLSIQQEIRTQPIIETCIKDGKNIFVPILTEKKREMVFCPLENLESLTKNKFGILEPPMKGIKKSDNKTIILVPALVYSKDKFRIGYGGGYYDKYIKENEALANIGLCLSEFIIAGFEKDKYDEKVDFIITENEVF